MNILVTGASGQLGRCIQDLAQKYPDFCFVFTNTTELNIINRKEVKDIFENNSFDYCVNCAAYTAVDLAESETQKANLINTIGVRYLAEECKNYNTILIHISTDFVFDGTKNTPYNENDIPNPINIYGLSKYKGEQEIYNLLERYFIIRTSWVYSEYGHNFLKTMLRLGRKRDELKVVSDQIGTPTYAGDLAEIILKFIENEVDHYGIYHYSNNGVASWYDFAKEIFKISGTKVNLMPIKTESYPTPAKRPAFSVMDKEKIMKVLNIRIPEWKASLKKGIEKQETIKK